MSGVLRSVNTRFWDDPFIRSLAKDEKLIFLYLLTNPLSNISGIYEITLDRIMFDTGEKRETVRKAFKTFEAQKRVFYYENYVILKNFLKNQNLNTNMQRGVEKIVKNLPDSIKVSIFNSIGNASKGFDSIRESILKYEVESEVEEEGEVEEKKPADPLATWNNFAKENGLAKIAKITQSRRDKLNLRIKEGFDIEEVVLAINGQAFLFGNNKRKWKVTFDWLVHNDTNWVKVSEKKYIESIGEAEITEISSAGGQTLKNAEKVFKKMDEEVKNENK